MHIMHQWMKSTKAAAVPATTKGQHQNRFLGLRRKIGICTIVHQ